MNINGLMGSLQSGVAQGVLWGIMVLGVYITYKLLDIPDLTADGSFTLGGCVTTVAILAGVNPVLATLMGMGAGFLAGAVTGVLHTFFEIPAILAGILTQIGLWSVNLRIMSGKANNPLLKADTTVSFFTDKLGITNSQASMLVGILLVIAVILLLYWFFGTEIGSALRATGDNEDMIRALGVNTGHTKLLALAISNGLIGLSGAMVAQMQKYADINMGRGAIVIGLAAIVIGEVLLGRLVKNFGFKLFSAVIGSIVYFMIQALVLRLGMDANDMKLLSSIMVGAALAIPVAMGRYRLKKSYSENDLYADEHRHGEKKGGQNQ
ncbi:ABC transporter permease [Lachnoclostridium sp. An14]|uniref:ABC transporter permease n=1 Tax=Lachnoclostridium sp. An14 TaxID=1965562 RepID=UPI0019506B02|nr:ABC transporter permease [Lachnoclostridium sp. An14]